MGKQSTFREDYRKAFRLLNLVRTMDASILPQSILQAMLEAWSPMCPCFSPPGSLIASWQEIFRLPPGLPCGCWAPVWF